MSSSLTTSNQVTDQDLAASLSLRAAIDSALRSSVSLARRIHRTTSSLLFGFDAGRPQLLASAGLSSGDIPCACTLCAVLVSISDSVVIADALLDSRFRDHPLITGSPHIRFIASVPLRSDANEIIGILCVVDPGARDAQRDELDCLVDLATMLTPHLAEARIGSGRTVEHAHLRVEDDLRIREAELSSVIENANDAYLSHDEKGTVRRWNRQAEITFGWSRQEAIGQTLADLIIPQAQVHTYWQDMARFHATGSSAMVNQRLELPALRKDGSTIVVESRVTPLYVDERIIFSCFMHDISGRKQIEQQRDYESRHDALTGLANRRALMEMLPLAQARVHRNRQALALLFIDLDGFKAVNDSWGHDAGDQLLVAVAHRLVAAVRKTDTVFRLAGDEFTVLLEGLMDGGHDAAIIARKLIAAISEPVHFRSAVGQVGASIGIGTFRTDRDITAEALIKEADEAMYRAKRAGKGQVFPSYD